MLSDVKQQQQQFSILIVPVTFCATDGAVNHPIVSGLCSNNFGSEANFVFKRQDLNSQKYVLTLRCDEISRNERK